MSQGGVSVNYLREYRPSLRDTMITLLGILATATITCLTNDGLGKITAYQNHIPYEEFRKQREKQRLDQEGTSFLNRYDTHRDSLVNVEEHKAGLEKKLDQKP